MDHFPGTWGRVSSTLLILARGKSTVMLMMLQPRDDVYGPYDHSYLQSSGPNTHTQSPAVTGTSVIAVKFNGGVAMATDNLGTYSWQRHLGCWMFW